MLGASYTIKGIWAAFVAALFLIAIGFGVVQTVRLNGFSFWPFKVEGALNKVERLEDEIGAILAAQKDAKEAQQAVNDAAEAIYEDVAKRIDQDAKAQEASQLDAVERYIRANRVRCPATGGSASGADTAAEDNSARDREALPGPYQLDGAVAVSEADVKACTLNTIQANAAREWALELEAASKGE